MAQPTTSRTERSPTQVWRAGVVAGLTAGVGMGLVLQLGANAMPVVGALVGWPTLLGGWVVHLVTSVVFALLFAAVASQPILSEYTDSTASTTGLGVGYGAFLGLLTGGVLFPLWVNAAETAGVTLAVPLLPVPGLVSQLAFAVTFGVAHVVYGMVLGGTYALLRT